MVPSMRGRRSVSVVSSDIRITPASEAILDFSLLAYPDDIVYVNGKPYDVNLKEKEYHEFPGHLDKSLRSRQTVHIWRQVLQVGGFPVSQDFASARAIFLNDRPVPNSSNRATRHLEAQGGGRT